MSSKEGLPSTPTSTPNSGRKRSRKQNFRGITPDTQFEQQVGTASMAPPSPSLDTPTPPAVAASALVVAEAATPSRKRRSSDRDSCTGPGKKMLPRKKKRSMDDDNIVIPETSVLSRTEDIDTWCLIDIDDNIQKITEFLKRAKEETLSGNERLQYIPNQPVPFEGATRNSESPLPPVVGSTVLAPLECDEASVYRAAVVLSKVDARTFSVRFVNDPDRIEHLRQRNSLRVFSAAIDFELDMMIKARFRRGACDVSTSLDVDAEVESINTKGNQRVASSNSKRDLEIRTPNRIFRVAKDSSVGPCQPDYLPVPPGEKPGCQFMKSDVLCQAQKRQRFNGSQWRTLCAIPEGCDRESQDKKRCSMHSRSAKKEASSACRSSSVDRYPTPCSKYSGGTSRQGVASRPEVEAAQSLLELGGTQRPHSATLPTLQFTASAPSAPATSPPMFYPSNMPQIPVSQFGPAGNNYVLCSPVPAEPIRPMMFYAPGTSYMPYPAGQASPAFMPIVRNQVVPARHPQLATSTGMASPFTPVLVPAMSCMQYSSIPAATSNQSVSMEDYQMQRPTSLVQAGMTGTGGSMSAESQETSNGRASSTSQEPSPEAVRNTPPKTPDEPSLRCRAPENATGNTLSLQRQLFPAKRPTSLRGKTPRKASRNKVPQTN